MEKTIIEKLAIFIQDSEKNLTRSMWISDEYMSVYVRKAKRYLSGKMSTTLDIASVTIDEDKQGQGIWTDFLAKAHELNPWDATYVENVLNPILAGSLLRHGWIVMGESFLMPKDPAKYFEQQFLKQKFTPDAY